MLNFVNPPVAIEKLYEIRFFRLENQAQFVDENMDVLRDHRGDDKIIVDDHALHVLLHVLDMFGHRFIPLWNIDHGDTWILRRDGQENRWERPQPQRRNKKLL